MNKCTHENFNAHVEVSRIADSKPMAFMADVKIECRDCKLPFEFIGVKAGLDWKKPMCNPSAQEIRLPIKPKGSVIMPALPGFKMRAN